MTSIAVLLGTLGVNSVSIYSYLQHIADEIPVPAFIFFCVKYLSVSEILIS